jgi:hypothetical protein
MLAIILLLGLVVCAATARAAETGAIAVTVSLATETSVTLTPTSWNIGAIALGSTNGPTSFTATVGNINTKLEIKGEDPPGGWTIGSPPASDRFEVAVASPALTLTTSYQVLAASVTFYQSLDFGLTYKAPTGDTKGGGVNQDFNITVKASAAP